MEIIQHKLYKWDVANIFDYLRKHVSSESADRFLALEQKTLDNAIANPTRAASITRIMGYENFDDLEKILAWQLSKTSNYYICNSPVGRNYILACLTLNTFVNRVTKILRDREETKNA